jgi:hypothetical protein
MHDADHFNPIVCNTIQDYMGVTHQVPQTRPDIEMLIFLAMGVPPPES